MSRNICSVVLMGVLGLFSLIGILSNYFLDKKQKKKLVDFVNGLLFSMLAMIMILYLMPEIYDCLGFTHMYLLFIFFIIGYIIMKLFSNYYDMPRQSKRTKKDFIKENKYMAYMLNLIFILYNIIVGVEIYNTILKSVNDGISLTIGFSIKNLVMGFIIYYFMNQEKVLKIKKVATIILFTLTPIIGTISMMLFNRTCSAIFLGSYFSLILGMMVFPLVTEIIINLKKATNKKRAIIGIVLGALIVAVSCLV